MCPFFNSRKTQHMHQILQDHIFKMWITDPGANLTNICFYESCNHELLHPVFIIHFLWWITRISQAANYRKLSWIMERHIANIRGLRRCGLTVKLSRLSERHFNVLRIFILMHRWQTGLTSISKNLKNRQRKLEIRGRIGIVQTTALLKSVMVN